MNLYPKTWALAWVLTLAGVLALAPARPAAAQQSPSIDVSELEIPYHEYTLDNGLRLVVHEDDKAPIVAVNVWYHVGSKNEPAGRSGFAHLFEHLMFNGTEHYDGEYFTPFEQVGATDMNGTTNQDRTNYFQNVPKNALDMALWMESDRMGHLLGAITQEKLDEQRGVVQNEKRQGENQPYGQVWNLITENTYPEGHPYAHSVIGSMEDLNAAELEDVKEWFRSYYGPNNAVLVVAGDVDPEDVRQRVEKYFGHIPPSPPIAKQQTWVAPMTGEHRTVLQDRVPQARIYKVWNVPAWGSEEATYLDLASDVLSSGKTSRLYKRLVYDDQIATNAWAFLSTGEIGSQFMIMASVKPGEDAKAVEQAIDQEMQRFLQEGPTADELSRVRTEYLAGFVRGTERIGGFGGKSDILAQNAVYGGDPGHYRQTLQWVQDAAPEDLHQAARKWLSDGVYTLEVRPFAEYATVETDVDRSQGLPDVGEAPAASFPALQRATLSNGMEIVLAERSGVPLVQMDLLVDAGYAADQQARPGTASLAMNALDEGAGDMDALTISETLDRLGATLSTGANLDVSEVSLSTLKQTLDPALDVFADVVLRPTFPEQDVERLKQQRLAQIQQEKNQPVQMALRVFPTLVYGEGHAYSTPFTGSGYAETVQALSASDLRAYHATWFKPNNATLVVVGDVSMDELRPRLEQRFGSWQRGDVPQKNIAEVDLPPSSRVYLVDRPDAQQSVIIAGHLAPPKANDREFALQAANEVLGGSFTSRMNMNLREDKHWSYGARTILPDAEGQRPFFVYAPVQTDKTKESVQEIVKELQGITGGTPPSAEELDKAKKSQTLTLPGRWETLGAVASSVGEIVRFGLADDYYQTYAGQVRALALNDLSTAASETIRPDQMVWVVVGDRSQIEQGIRELDLGPIQVIDADGNPMETTSSAD